MKSADQLGTLDHIGLGCLQDIRNRCRGRHAQARSADCHQSKMIMVNTVTLWRAGAAVAGLAEVVARLMQAGGGSGCAISRVQPMGSRRRAGSPGWQASEPSAFSRFARKVTLAINQHRL